MSCFTMCKTRCASCLLQSEMDAELPHPRCSHLHRQQLSRGRSAVHWTRFTPISANRSMFCPVIRLSFTTSSYFVRHTWRLRLTTRSWTNNETENKVYSVQSFMILATSEKQRIDLVILRLTSTFSYPFYSSPRITSQLTST